MIFKAVILTINSFASVMPYKMLILLKYISSRPYENLGPKLKGPDPFC